MVELSPLELIFLVTALAVVPMIALICTSFLRVLVVVSIVRAAFGTQNIVPNFVTAAFAIIVTAVVMQPVATDIHVRLQAFSERLAATSSQKLTPAVTERASERTSATKSLNVQELFRTLRTHLEAGMEVIEPLRGFLATHSASREKEFVMDALNKRVLARITRTASESETVKCENIQQADKALTEIKPTQLPPPAPAALYDSMSWMVVIPSFLLSELRLALTQGIFLALPLVVVDLCLMLVVTAVGATSVSPQTLALPTKLIVFTGCDGWVRLFELLVGGYRT